MLTGILSFLGSSVMGSLVGWIGGVVNRWMDMKAKAQENAFQLQQMDKQRAYMLEEAKVNLQLEQEKTEREIEVAGYAAMQGSYTADREAYGGGMVDTIRGLTRPTVTVLMLMMTTWIAAEVFAIAEELTPAQAFDLKTKIVEWTLFQTAVCVGWWFATRPARGK